MKIKIFEKGFNYSQDGPGNRLVLHLQGCNMHCHWCANPEGIPLKAPLIVDEKMLLESVCPYGAITGKNLMREKCDNCENMPCITENKNKGIYKKCIEYEVSELLNEVLDVSPMFFDGGGVTLTGGEPLMQFEAVNEFLTLLKNNGINTAIETNAASDKLPALFPITDTLICDFKCALEERHKAITGVSIRKVKDNIRKAIAVKKIVNIRIPLIGGFNTDDLNIDETIAFFNTIDKNYITLELLRFHEFGKEKWKQTGQSYIMIENAYVSNEVYKNIYAKMTQNGIKMIKT